MTVTMNRLELVSGTATWTQPDKVKITVPAIMPAKTAAAN
jgi:hypothetical protein